jgi:hypothetical protein
LAHLRCSLPAGLPRSFISGALDKPSAGRTGIADKTEVAENSFLAMSPAPAHNCGDIKPTTKGKI